ncbi:hypothetical protein [Mesoterricola silvestris]|uniref:Uncharacterized protein n=1 Tax=Mesoterricola silvestris TaxID=2927979 RepID=A0AA48GGL0_9BACT|nr:hypothetical protein [Mesoterricola silvestris]BDU72416.1 hypothetical protein METEAL_15900 [Mesoterricola silvestris]
MPLSLPFSTGQLVVAVLREPRERMWGRLLGLEASGLALRGLDLRVWEEVLAMVRRGEDDQVALGTRFFPMHRVESLYLDEPSSGVPSLGADFLQRTGRDPGDFLRDL